MKWANWERRLFVSQVVISCALILTWGIALVLPAKRAAVESAQLALMEEAAKLLDAYHKGHGAYAKSMNVFAFSYPDGGDESILATLHYISDGTTFSLTTKGIATDREWATDSSSGGLVVSR